MGPECEEAIDTDASYLASVAAAVTLKIGTLPKDPKSAALIVSQTAPDLPVQWPADLELGSNGSIIDCSGALFELSVYDDRIAVTSPTLRTYYFASRPRQ